MEEQTGKQKVHRKRLAGPKAAKKKAKNAQQQQDLTPQQRNPKAFSIQHANKTLRTVQRTQDLKTKKQHIPLVDRTPLEPPPVIVGVVGPPKVGKTTLLKCIVKNFTKQRLTRIQGPVTVVSGKQRRLTLIECNNDISAMIDIAKVADLVLLLVDASFGFEMETFEFLNICQVHGFPRIMGVLTHLDTFKDSKKLRKTKKRLKHRFWTEVYQGAKLFYLSGMVNGEYQKTEVHNLCRFISVMKFRPLTWRTTHPYILADRMEDITDPESVRKFNKCDRNVSLYGYLHGTHMKNNINVHIAGCGDFSLHDVQFLNDPCPTPEKQKKRSLSQRDRLVYAPMSGVGGIVYDKDAVYIDLGGSHSHSSTQKDQDVPQPINELVSSLMALNDPLDKKMTTSRVSLYSEGIKVAEGTQENQDGNSSQQFETVQASGRVRRRAIFKEDGNQNERDDNDDDEDSGRESDEGFDDDDDGPQNSEKAIPGTRWMDDFDNEISFKSMSKKSQIQSKKSEDQDESGSDNDDEEEVAFKPSSDVKKSSKTMDKIDKKFDSSDSNGESNEDESDMEVTEKSIKGQSQELDDYDSDDDSDDGSDNDDDDDDDDDDDFSDEEENNKILSVSKKQKKEGKVESSAQLKQSQKMPSASIVTKSIEVSDISTLQDKQNKHQIMLSSDFESDSESNSDTDEETLTSVQSKCSKQDKARTRDLEDPSESDFESESEIDSDKDVLKLGKTKALNKQEKGGKSKSEKGKEVIKAASDRPEKEANETIKSLSDKLLSLSQTDYYSWKKAEQKDTHEESFKDKDEEMEEDYEGDSMEDGESEGSGYENEDENYQGESFQWKRDLAAQAAANFRERQSGRINYRKLIYGKEEESTDNKDEEAEDEIGGLFKILKEKSEASAVDRVAVNSTDCSKPQKYTIIQLEVDKIQEMIADCFVTGKWDKGVDAEALLKEDDELYGDFEDLETGESHTADDKESAENEDDEGDKSEQDDETEKQPEEVKKKKSEMTADERRAEKKRKLKEMFDQQYDMKGDTEFYDNWKQELEEQAKINKSVFEDMDDELRVQYEGFRPGMYVRVEIHGVPCEFVTNFDPTYPIILGGLLSVENTVGYVQTRLKKHRWHKKILKTKNPLIFSLGWRRFQSIPLYSIQDHNMRNRLLKYTPEHLHCNACFWGPITPQGTGLLAVENIANVTPDFRIAATGVVLELDKSFQIVKKLKLTGTPQKIYRKTAFVQGMFNSSLEVAKFEGATLRTVSGIRGQIKKAVKMPEGTFRATFEDKILLSDIVFLRTWYPVEVPQFYNPVTTMLLPPEQKQNWTGLKTYGDLYREKNIKPTFSDDSKYKKIERKGKSYVPLSIPKALQRVLPFKDTPKSLLEKNDSFKRVAVIREPHEAKISKMVSMLKNVYEHKRRTEHAQMRQRASEHQKKMQKVNQEKQKRQQEAKKRVFRMLGKMEKRKNKNND